MSRGKGVFGGHPKVPARASMGPRLMSRGKIPTSCRGPTPFAACFNGAAAHEPRKDKAGQELVAKVGSFNGAAAHEPRKGIGKNPCQIPERSFNGAAAHEPRKAIPASPRGRARCSRFNGAAAHEPRKGGGRQEAVRVHDGASMGPRLMSRGKVVVMTNQAILPTLQWGRGS